MKKFAAVLLAAVLLCLAGCAGAAPEPSPTPEPEWVGFIAEFEAWTYDFIDLYRAVIASPHDMELRDRLTAMTEQAAQWDADVKEIEACLTENPEAYNAFTAEVNRVVKILNDYLASANT